MAVRIAARTVSTASSSRRSASGSGEGSHPERPFSSARKPFSHACWNVRPIAITSPTAFICTPSVASAFGNFSNAKRGIFTTM